MSYADLAPTGVASQHLPQTKWPGYIQTRPRTSRLLQLHSNTSGMFRPPQITTDYLQISPTDHLKQHWNSWNAWKCLNWKTPEILMPTRSLQYRGLGQPSWLTPTPGYVVHVSYLTTPKALPETPCRTTLVQIRRPEWMVHTRGWKTPNWTNPIWKNPKTVRKPD